VPIGFKHVQLPVVRFDPIQAVGTCKECEDDDEREFIIYPEGELVSKESQAIGAPLFHSWIGVPLILITF
jgi:hypothetical protein